MLQSLADDFAPIQKVTVGGRELQSGLITTFDGCDCSRECLSVGFVHQNSEVIENSGSGMNTNGTESIGTRRWRIGIFSLQTSRFWRSMSTLLGKGATKKSDTNFPTAQDVLNFFIEKVDAVRRASYGGPPESQLPPAPAVLQFFSPVFVEIKNVIYDAPSKTCALDPILSHVVKEFPTQLLQFHRRSFQQFAGDVWCTIG